MALERAEKMRAPVSLNVGVFPSLLELPCFLPLHLVITARTRRGGGASGLGGDEGPSRRQDGQGARGRGSGDPGR